MMLPVWDVLVLDDDPLIRMVTVDALEEAGLVAHEAGSLTEARAAVASARYRVLLVDHDLGEPDGTTGFAFARCIRAVSPETAVIYATGRWEHFGALLTQRERNLPKPFVGSRVVALAKELLASA